MKIYVASSWRNMMQSAVVATLRCAKFEVYDFKNPAPGNEGFAWKEVDPNWMDWAPEKFVECLQAPVAQAGFNSDFDAMKWADCGVLVLPCGRSAHLEAGYFVGAGKPLHILLHPEKFEPELMYLMATTISCSMFELLGKLGVKD